MKKFNLSFFALTLLLISVSQASDVVSNANDRQSVQITLFEHMAHVSETRSVALKPKMNKALFEDFSPWVDEESFQLTLEDNATGSSIQSIEFISPTSSMQQLLGRYIGKQVLIEKRNEAGHTLEKKNAELIFADSKYAYRTEDGIRIDGDVFPTLPDENLAISGRPKISADIESAGGIQPFRIGYVTKGLSWYPRYRVEINEAKKQAELQGWAIINNQSSQAFDDARVAIVAGDIRSAAVAKAPVYGQARMMMAEAVSMDSGFQSTGDRQVYSIGKTVSIPYSGVVQLPIVEPKTLPLKVEYEMRGIGNISYQPSSPNDKMPVSAFWVIQQDKQDDQPTPKGIAELFVNEKNQELYFGSVRLEDNSAGDVIRINSGNAFDIYAKKRMLDNNMLAQRLREVEAEVTVYNRKNEDVVVAVYEQVWGDWSVVSSSMAHEKADANSLKFNVKVKAKSETTVRYKVQIKN